MDYIFGPSGVDVVKGRKLQVRIGSSIDTLAVAKVNNDNDPHFIDSPYFTGFLVVRVKNFEGVVPTGARASGSGGPGATGEDAAAAPPPLPEGASAASSYSEKDSSGSSEDYFNGKKRLFALQLSGRFKHNYSADDVVFGSQFERKCTPPYGSSIAMKFASLIDPALQTDIFCDNPWIFSPILCSMNVVNVQKAVRPIVDAAPSVKKTIVRKGSEKDGEVGGGGSVKEGKPKKHGHQSEKSGISSNSTSALPKETAKGDKKGSAIPNPTPIDNGSSLPDTMPDLSTPSSNPEAGSIEIQCPDPSFIADPRNCISAPLSRVPSSAQSRVNMLDKWTWRGGSKELEEDTRLFQQHQTQSSTTKSSSKGPADLFAHDSWAERRKYFQKARCREDTIFSPDHIYNFEIYAPFINLSTFDLSLGININVLQYLNNQPLRMMAKSLSLGKYLFVIEFDLVDDPPSSSQTSGSKDVLSVASA